MGSKLGFRGLMREGEAEAGVEDGETGGLKGVGRVEVAKGGW